jgi:cytochrome c oxidase subunit II
MWGNNNMIKHSLIKATFGFALAIGLGTSVSLMSPAALAQTKETFHKQNNNNDQVHAHGTVETRSALESWAPPKSISSYGHRLDWLFEYTSWVATIFFIIMTVALVYFSVRYRARPGHKAYYTHGKANSSEKWAPKLLDLAVFVSLDLVLIGSSYIHTRDFIWNYPAGPDVVRVQVMPQQWVWNFRYPGRDDTFGTDDDITTINDMRVPKGKPVMVQIMSRDVIHGFYITNVRAQMDAIPGSITKFWFDANTVGDFEIACAHLCGTAHYKMKGFLKVMEESDYTRWSEEASDWAKAAFDPADPSVKWGWNWALNQK